jgi:hypothetical protein
MGASCTAGPASRALASKGRSVGQGVAWLTQDVGDAKTFPEDRECLSRSGRYDLKRLKEAMVLLIANDAPPGPEWLDHSRAARRRVIRADRPRAARGVRRCALDMV